MSDHRLSLSTMCSQKKERDDHVRGVYIALEGRGLYYDSTQQLADTADSRENRTRQHKVCLKFVAVRSVPRRDGSS